MTDLDLLLMDVNFDDFIIIDNSEIASVIPNDFEFIVVKVLRSSWTCLRACDLLYGNRGSNVFQLPHALLQTCGATALIISLMLAGVATKSSRSTVFTSKS